MNAGDKHDTYTIKSIYIRSSLGLWRIITTHRKRYEGIDDAIIV